MNITVFRVQDKDGRGPYRPGYSHTWIDPDHNERNPTFFDEFGWSDSCDICDIRSLWHANENGGCAFRTLSGLYRWFSRNERAKLERAGFSIVTMRVDRIIAESDNQLVFGRVRPLRNGCTIIPWRAEFSAALPNTVAEREGR